MRFLFVRKLCLALVSAGYICAASAQAPLVKDLGYTGGSIHGIRKINNALNFILMGDWGRNGENYQKQVALQMGRAAHDLDASFVVATGDNFYPYGVASTQDYQWISSYESIYTAQSLHVRWYAVLGNHDYGTSPDAQVAYSGVSSRWTMPSRYYSRTFISGNDSILVAFLDTDPIEKELRGAPHDSVRYVQGAVEAQMKWLENVLSQSSARWKFVVGHHPLYTGGWRKNSDDTKRMKQFLEPVFMKHGVDLYLCGHEHHLEYIKPEGKTHYIISGAASEARPAKLYPRIGKFSAAVQGFATVSVTHEQVVIQFINYKGQILNESTITK